MASELQDDGAEADEADEADEDAEDAEEAADPAARGSNEDAAAINEKLWLGRKGPASRVEEVEELEVEFVWMIWRMFPGFAPFFFVGVVFFSERMDGLMILK